MTFVDNVRGDVLGAVGVIFLLYTTLSMIQKVEEAFNFVWRVAQPRSLMDSGPAITQEFKRNTDYILDCEGTPSIHVAEPQKP